ncbi:predicted protein [Sparassis crispa]|uniref:Uncharacterized protein n=1 Tax=Sparassis crispa TaxID=139825 RepID=A0A401GBE2_9APHY|nr:predicted protein [Sparassis crispa]GBE79484.1 predicted protein [Sparassis crispa]
MLSNSVSATPRPRPPAKTRKIPSIQFSRPPPPPYVLEEEMTLGSPIPPPLVASDVRRLSLPTHPGEDWNDRSREELSGLLLKADELIKSRETELSFTSALCKSLYEGNIKLKTKHDTLISRIPSTRTASPAPITPLVSTAPTSPSLAPTPIIQSPFMLGDSRVLSPGPTTQRIHHSRRISVTPTELAHLADQNAELLDKLEKLEAESQQADQAGKRKLHKLEKEIQTLREELESTQAKGAELEEQAKAANMSASEVQRRKEERVERLKALKEKSASGPDFASEEVRDFAPPSKLPKYRPHTTSIDSAEEVSAALAADLSGGASLSDPSESDGSDHSHDDGENDTSSFLPMPYPSRSSSQLVAESAIVSQLLLKIRELEETNAQIIEDQRATGGRLRAAQRDAEGIRQLYDCLSDGAEVELQVGPDDADSPVKGESVFSGDTIKFSSLRRTIDSDLSGYLSAAPDPFASGITNDMQSTTRSIHVPNMSSGSHKTRKSVVGLFDRPVEPSPAFVPSGSVRLAPTGDFSILSTATTNGLNPLSPPLSSLQTPDGLGFGRTLGSELGSEFGDDWGENAGNHHLRTSSLYDLAAFNISRDMSSTSLVSPTAEKSGFAFPSLETPSSSGTTRQGEWEENLSPSTPPFSPSRPGGPQFNIQPPTPSPDKLREASFTRSLRLSQIVHSRTHRWVERRSAHLPETQITMRSRRSFADTSRSLDTDGESFDQAAQAPPGAVISENVSMSARTKRAADGDAGADSGAEAEGDCSALELRGMSCPHTSAVLRAESSRQEGFVGVMLEVWLWIQFVIVVFVFLWAMAKRGPKNVLEEAERRRAQQASSSG